VLAADELYIGANAVDYSGYPDCRPEFIAAFSTMSSLATKAGVEGHPIRVEAPIIDMSKAEIIQLRHATRCRLCANRILLPGGFIWVVPAVSVIAVDSDGTALLPQGCKIRRITSIHPPLERVRPLS